MKILIDIGHPAHVHLFKYFAWEMQKKGHEIFFTCREKEFEIDLLKTYGFNFESFGKKYSSTPGKIWGLIKFDVREYLTGRKFKPDILLSHGSMYAAHAAFLLGKPHISLEDTFNFEQIKLYEPFTKLILTSDYKHPLQKEKIIRYSGYHELAYLHSKFFSPDKNVLMELNVKENEKYVIIRFVSWKATHDAGHNGVSFENKVKMVKDFEKHAKVFISSESELPSKLSAFQIKIAPHRMHDVLAFATFLFSESATMASECAMLGTPSIYLDNTGRYYTKDLESKYGLVFNYSESEEDQQRAIEKGIEILKTPNIKDEWQIKRKKMLADKIDVTAFLVWFIENYPDSVTVMRQNPDFQYRFK